jgi:hypothetical protein
MSKRSAEVGRVDFLAGEIHALLSFAAAISKTHPNPALIRVHCQAAFQVGLAKIEAMPHR